MYNEPFIYDGSTLENIKAAEDRVNMGVQLLDDVLPGWENDIDLGKLDLFSCSDCVLGQLYGDYAFGLEQVGLKTGFHHGFQGVSSVKRVQQTLYEEYKRLTEMWSEAITQKIEG